MTSIEWLYAELAKNNNSNDSIKERIYRQAQIWKDAKEMHKQEIIDAHISGYDSSGESAKDYYDFYYGSKGSDTLKDYHIVDTNEMVDVPQQEISDEEIEKSISYDSKDPYVEGYINGAKWYREQLKSRQ